MNEIWKISNAEIRKVEEIISTGRHNYFKGDKMNEVKCDQCDGNKKLDFYPLSKTEWNGKSNRTVSISPTQPYPGRWLCDRCCHGTTTLEWPKRWEHNCVGRLIRWIIGTPATANTFDVAADEVRKKVEAKLDGIEDFPEFGAKIAITVTAEIDFEVK